MEVQIERVLFFKRIYMLFCTVIEKKLIVACPTICIEINNIYSDLNVTDNKVN